MKPSKMNKLTEIVGRTPKAVIAFSGGVDSSLLLKLCSDILGKRNVVAVTGVSQTYTREERAVARRFTKELGVRHVLLETDELACRNFSENPGDRCYYCKQELYGKISRLARRSGIPVIFDATNADDLSDHRPGRKAAAEFGVVSPRKISVIIRGGSAWPRGTSRPTPAWPAGSPTGPASRRISSRRSTGERR